MSCCICLMGEECAAWEQIKARNHHWGKNEVDVKKSEKKTKPWHKNECVGKDTI